MLIHQQNVPEINPKFDLTAVKDSFQRLIDPLGGLLDDCHSFGFAPYFMQEEPLRIYLELAKAMEVELLLEWKILQQEGMDGLAKHQRTWLHMELRRAEGFFATWGHLLQSLWKEPARLGLSDDPWQSYILSLATEERFSTNWACSKEGFKALFGTLQKIHHIELHHQVLSFLNLIELGAKERPNLLALGSFAKNKNQKLVQISASLHKAKQWGEQEGNLHSFWEEESK